MTNQSDIKKLAEQMASSMKSFDDIKDFQKQLMQSFIDTALEAEMEEHLGYPKHEKADRPNKRNGHTKKRVRSDTGELEISTPRDRDSSFEPVLVSKHQTRISGLDDKIISFYAKRARGLFVRAAAEANWQTPADLQKFDAEGYGFVPAASTETKLVFRRRVA